MTSKLAVCGGEPLFKEPLQRPAFPPTDEATAQALAQLYLSGNWSFGGPEENAFAEEYAAYHGARHGIFMANGTVTLQCALDALNVGEGDEVIVPGLTWLATATAVLSVGATPVFVDVEATTLCLDPQAFEAAITPQTRAVIPVHLYGSTADLDAILAIAKRHNIAVIEDCAHAQGGVWNGRGVGSWGAVGSFSFQQSKTLASGEGGLCLTNDDALAERIYRAKHIGYGPGVGQGKATGGPPQDLTCHNFRATEFQALILRSQLKHLKERIATYNRSAAILEERLESIEGLRPQARGHLADPQSYYAFGIIREGDLTGIPLDVFQRAIHAEGLGIDATYGTVYHHSLFNIDPKRYRIEGGRNAVAEDVAQHNTLTLLHPWLESDDDTLHKIADVLEKVANNAGALREEAAEPEAVSMRE